MTVYGYARVSHRDQNLARQLDALDAFGCGAVYADKASGRDFERPEWHRLMSALRPGDVVAVKSIDRLGRDYDGILEAWREITHVVGADIVVLDMPLLDTRERITGLAGRLMGDIVLQLLSYVAQQEREFIHQRQAEGIAAAKARGVRFGRPSKKIGRARHEFELAYADYSVGAIGAQKVAERCGVCLTTAKKWISDAERCE